MSAALKQCCIGESRSKGLRPFAAGTTPWSMTIRRPADGPFVVGRKSGAVVFYAPMSGIGATCEFSFSPLSAASLSFVSLLDRKVSVRSEHRARPSGTFVHRGRKEMAMQLTTIRIDKPDATNFILGQTHFIKSVEDIHETLVGAVPGIKFGLAFCEASGKCLVRSSGTDAAMVQLGIVTLAQYRRSLAVLARRRETQAIDFAHVGRGAATAIDK
jgi:adenosine specific kinase